MIALLIAMLMRQPADPGGYSVWSAPHLHLMMDDNGTPDDYSDDRVVDWEDNRSVIVKILDK